MGRPLPAKWCSTCAGIWSGARQTATAASKRMVFSVYHYVLFANYCLILGSRGLHGAFCMLLAQRVSLQGLMRASNLHGRLGSVEAACAERATVRVDSGGTVSAMLENITSRPRPPGGAALPASFHSQNRSSDGSSSRAAQPADASASAGQPTLTSGPSAFAMVPATPIAMDVARLQAVRAQLDGRRKAAHMAARNALNRCANGLAELPVDMAE